MDCTHGSQEEGSKSQPVHLGGLQRTPVMSCVSHSHPESDCPEKHFDVSEFVPEVLHLGGLQKTPVLIRKSTRDKRAPERLQECLNLYLGRNGMRVRALTFSRILLI